MFFYPRYGLICTVQHSEELICNIDARKLILQIHIVVICHKLGIILLNEVI